MSILISQLISPVLPYPIMSTHQLFMMFDEETIALLQEQNYHLIIDEALNSVSVIKTKVGKTEEEDEIFKAFDNLRKSDFLRGKVTGINGKPFNCTFDWFINIANFTKVLEGAYNDTSISDQTAETKELTPDDYLKQGSDL